MADEIINRVANSKLQVIDLEDFYPEGKRIAFDIKDWLLEGLVLREKDFRTHVAEHDWSQYQDAYVALYCSTDAIVPDWAYMLISVQLQDIAKLSVIGNLEQLESILYAQIISDLDISDLDLEGTQDRGPWPEGSEAESGAGSPNPVISFFSPAT